MPIVEEARALIKAHDEWTYASADLERPGAWDGRYRWAKEIVKMHEALQYVVECWESLPGDNRYSPRIIEEWLRRDMAGALARVREVLGVAVLPREDMTP